MLCEYCKHRRPEHGGDGECPLPGTRYIAGTETGMTHCPQGYEHDYKARKLKDEKKERRKERQKQKKKLEPWIQKLVDEGRISLE